jgi:mannose-6-phosphate isomerase-like protein (cupin superfamily)
VAEAGQRFEMPEGSVYTVRTPAAATGGDYVEMEFELPADCVAPPPHIHPQQVEEYQVIEGSFDVMVDGEWSTIGPGESASVPVGASHTFRNPTEETIRVLNWHRPAVDFEAFIEDVHTAFEQAGVESRRDPRVPIFMSTFFMKYPETLVVSRRRERIPMKAMAGLGRLLGVGRRLPSERP